MCGLADELEQRRRIPLQSGGGSPQEITNIFAQAGKSQVPIVILPTDVASEMDSRSPKGNVVKVCPRPIDLENVEKLRQFPGMTVVKAVEELRAWLNTCL
jgi:flavoprotein